MQALKKATFKPAAFFKGILLPLASSGSVTLREAVVLSSVISRVSLPALHAAAALLRLADMPYCGTTSFFIRVLLDKKYALPQRVIAALTAHFVSFSTDGRVLPVVWHQTLLCFVQRYKLELSAGQRSELRDLCRAQSHYRVTPEVIRELDAADQAAAAAVAAAAAGGGSRGQQSVAVFMSSGGYYHQQQQQQQMGRHVVEDVRNMPPVPMMDD